MMRALIWAVYCLLPAAALTQDPQDELLRLYRAAQAAQAAGKPEIAAQDFEAIVRLRPDMAEAHADLGNAYFQQGKTDRASSAYKKAIQLKPELTGPYFFLGMMAFNSRAYTDAARYFEQAEKLEPQNAMVCAYLGYTYYAQAGYGRAARELERAATANPGDQDVLYHLSKAYSHLARLSLVRLKTTYPDSVYTSLVRGQTFEAEGNWESAQKEYAKALTLMPGNRRLQTKMQAHGNGGDFDELIDGSLGYLYRPPAPAAVGQEFLVWQEKAAALENAPGKSAESLYKRGQAYQILSYLAALSVIALDPASYRAHELQAQLYESAGKDEDAIHEYREVLRLQPDLSDIHFAIGTLLWKDQHSAEAEIELLQMLQRSPHHPQTLYELGDIALSSERPAEAERYYLLASKYEPNMIEAHYALEKIYTERGEYKKSIDHLEAAMALDPASATPHYRMAQIYRKLGRTVQAQAELTKFEQLKTK